jgi:hypothetical protein
MKYITQNRNILIQERRIIINVERGEDIPFTTRSISVATFARRRIDSGISRYNRS